MFNLLKIQLEPLGPLNRKIENKNEKHPNY